MADDIGTRPTTCYEALAQSQIIVAPLDGQELKVDLVGDRLPDLRERSPSCETA